MWGRIIAAVGVLSAFSVSVNAATVVAEASAFANATDVSNAYAGVTLSAITGFDFQVTGSDLTGGSSGSVFIFERITENYSTFTDLINEGNRWTTGNPNRFLLAEFLSPVSFVSVNYTPTGTPDTGVFQAYDANDNLLSHQTLRQLDPFVLEYTATSQPVAYILVGYADPGDLTGLTFTSVPIPTTFWLFGSALGLLGWVRRKEKCH